MVVALIPALTSYADEAAFRKLGLQQLVELLLHGVGWGALIVVIRTAIIRTAMSAVAHATMCMCTCTVRLRRLQAEYEQLAAVIVDMCDESHCGLLGALGVSLHAGMTAAISQPERRRYRIAGAWIRFYVLEKKQADSL